MGKRNRAEFNLVEHEKSREERRDCQCDRCYAASKVKRCACGCPVDAQGVCQASSCEAEDAERGLL